MARGLSLQERKERLIEECAACVAGGGVMTVGSDGFQGSADPKGPSAGFDPLLTKTLKKLKKRKVEEGYEPLPADKMSSKIGDRGERAKIHMNVLKGHKKLIKDGKHPKDDYSDRFISHKKDILRKLAKQTKKINHELRRHDPVDSRFKELENRDRGEKK